MKILRGLVYVLIFLVAAFAVAWWAARPATPDAFYIAEPRGKPGTLLRSEPFAKIPTDGTRAWRILYTTTRDDGTPAVASGVVMTSAAPASTPRPIVAWAHGTTGIAPGCAPSLLRDPYALVPAADRIASEGWVYVATDYVGLGTSGGHAYLVGREGAHGVLDAVRSTRQMPELKTENRVVVWGHSQGGTSALWAGIEALTYAPDVNLVGVAAFAPASDLRPLAAASRGLAFGRIVSVLLAHAYSKVYPDVSLVDDAGPLARLIGGDIVGRCVGDWGTLLSVLEAQLLPKRDFFEHDPMTGALGARLAQNTPDKPIAAPVLIAQGEGDALVSPTIQARFVATRCAAGQVIDYRAYPGRDHISLVALSSPLSDDIRAWTRDRIAGKPAPPTCTP
jgi:alpha-beta hydrolase superfamily lysophospholipase